MEEYVKAKKLGTAAFRQAVLKGEYPCVENLESITDTKTLARVPLGIIQIPMDMITGTLNEARGRSFARNFMPLMEEGTEFAYKWAAVYKAQETIGINDPVKVFEYKHRFYVQEGNKRVSVFRYLKSPTVTADVTRIMPEEKDSLYEAFLTFYKAAPVYEMDFTSASSYRKLCKIFGYSEKETWTKDNVQRLQSMYYSFRRIYEKTGNEASISDAFLLYLSLYGIEGIRRESETVIATRIRRMRDEIKVKKEKDISLVEAPQTAKATPKIPVLDLPVPDPLQLLTGRKKLHCAFIYDESPMTSPAVFEHETGRIFLENSFQGRITTEKYENCPSGEALRKALKKASENADVIFTTSSLQMDETLRTALANPDIICMNASLNQNVGAVISYDARTYEAKFLLGALAASLSKDHVLAFIADYPVYGTLAEINAFAIGAALIDPLCKVYLAWSETLDSDWKEQMKRLNIRMYCTEDSSFADNAEYGLFRLEDDESITNLACGVVNTAVYYEKLAKMMLDGTFSTSRKKAVNYWWGMSEGVVDVNLSGSIPYQAKKLITLLKHALMEGTLDPFAGELHSQNAVIQDAYAPRMKSSDIVAMDWLSDNIIGTLPPKEMFTRKAQDMMEVSGVGKDQ